MEVCTCTVRVGGNRNFEVVKKNVPVAEVMVLQHVHKATSIVDIEVTGKQTVDNAALKFTLSEKYPGALEFIDSAFKGYDADMPDTFAKAGIKTKKAAAKKKAAKKSKAKAKAAADDETDVLD